MKLSNSKVKTWRRCPNKYRYKYVERLEPKAKALPLARGSWMHELLQTHYDGEDWQKAHRKLSREFNTMFEEEREEYGDLPDECQRLMLSYLHRWRTVDKKLTVIDTELNEFITMPNGLRLNIVVDLIVEDEDGGLWVFDHKTRKKFGESTHMIIDPQLTLYFWGLERMGYKPLRGAVVNEIRTKAPAIPERLQSGLFTTRQNLDTDVFTYYKTVRESGEDPSKYSGVLQRLAKQPDKFFRRTRLPKDKPLTQQIMKELVQSANEIRNAERKNAFPRTIDQSCEWQCEFFNLCFTELHGGDISSQVKMNFQERRRPE